MSLNSVDAFTEAEYSNLIALARSKYVFVDVPDLFTANDPAMVWRHDVDYSPNRALALANIEHNHGVRAVYHFMVSSRYYNILEPETSALVKQIAKLGHFVGIHVDLDVFGHDGIDEKVVEDRIIFERSILEKCLDHELTSMSFHNYTINNKRMLYDDQVTGLTNASTERWFQEIKYVSDSNGIWRYQKLNDVLNEPPYERMMVLTHPVWWTPSQMTPFERFERSVDGLAKANKEFYLSILNRDGRLEKIQKEIGVPDMMQVLSHDS